MVKLKLWQGAEVLSGREYNFDLGIYNKIIFINSKKILQIKKFVLLFKVSKLNGK